MLLELTVENVAILDRCQLRLGPGFTALTGETGAGKSLLIDSIGLALGGRADSDLVRTGAARGVVTMSVDLSENQAARDRCADLGAELEDGVLFVQREVSAEGRSSCRIGGRLAPVNVLKQIGDLLVDLHGQHDHQTLFDDSQHLSYLDLWIGEPARVLVEQVAQQYAAVESLRRKHAQLRASQRDRSQRLDMLEFQIQEIEAVDPRPGEYEEVEANLRRLQHAGTLAQLTGEVGELLVNAEGAALERATQSVKTLESAARLDPTLEDPLEQLRSAVYALEEASRTVAHYSDAIEASPDMIELAAERLEALKRLRRKYGDDEAEVLRTLELAHEERALLADADSNLGDLESQIEEQAKALRGFAAELTKLRTDRSHEFAKLVTAELGELAMEKAVFEVRLSTIEPGPVGADALEFYFSSNVGEFPRPLRKIASGGEVSRVMLALKVVFAGRAGVPTLIFDEVDAGLSGRAAAVVANKLSQLAHHYQVIVISHLPQIAGRATTHFRIEKGERSGRVATSITALSGEDRVVEIARMLAGETVSEASLANARDLLGV